MLHFKENEKLKGIKEHTDDSIQWIVANHISIIYDRGKWIKIFFKCIV